MKKLVLVLSLMSAICFSSFASVFIKAEVPYFQEVLNLEEKDYTSKIFPYMDFAVCYEFDQNTAESFYLGLGISFVDTDVTDNTCFFGVGGFCYPIFESRYYAWNFQGEVTCLFNIYDDSFIIRPSCYIQIAQPEKKGFFLLTGFSYLVQIDSTEPHTVAGAALARGFGFKTGLGYHF